MLRASRYSKRPTASKAAMLEVQLMQVVVWHLSSRGLGPRGPAFIGFAFIASSRCGERAESSAKTHKSPPPHSPPPKISHYSPRLCRARSLC